MAGAIVAFILVFWIAPIVVGQQIGKRKGRAGWAWGLLLGWIGVIIVAVMSPTNTRECPWCREPVRLGAAVCPHCHRELPVNAPPIAPATATGQPKRRSAPAEERPALAQQRIDEAAKAVADGAYPKAFGPMYDESYEADRRGDVEALEVLLSLAKRIQGAPDAHARIRTDAHELAERLQQMLLRDAEPEAAEPQPEEVSAETVPLLPSSEPAVGRDSALDIVRERYARGEITREEFQRLSADLGSV